MSVFKVKLQNIEQGKLNIDLFSYFAGRRYSQVGTGFSTSKQRHIYMA